MSARLFPYVITTLGVAAVLSGFLFLRLQTDAALAEPPPVALAAARGEGDAAAILAAARQARYQANYDARFAAPVPPPPDQAPSDTPPPTVDVSAALDWTIASPQRRFDSRITNAPAQLTPAADGSMPSFIFNGAAAVMCEQINGAPQCLEVPQDWAQWAVPIMGQTPILFFPFIGELSDEAIAQAVADAQPAGTRDLLGEAASCFSFAALGPLEACFSPSGVPVQITAPAGGFSMNATGYTLAVDQARFTPPATPAQLPEGAAPPGMMPLPPGINPEDMARCMAATGDAARCEAELAPAAP